MSGPTSWGSDSGTLRADQGLGKLFVSFLPAISKNRQLNKISAEVRSWRLHHRTHLTEKDLAGDYGIGPDYGALTGVGPHPLLERINAYLMRWIRKKHERLRGKKPNRVEQPLKERPRYFAHWAWTSYCRLGDQNDKSLYEPRGSRTDLRERG